MSQHGYDREAQRLAHQALDGEYGDESHRLRLATAAQVYATLHMAEHMAERLDTVAERLNGVGDMAELLDAVAERLDAVADRLAELAARVDSAAVALEGGPR